MPYIKINDDNSVTVGGMVATQEMMDDGWFMYYGTIEPASNYTWDQLTNTVVPDLTKDRQAKLNAINKAYNNAIMELTKEYPEREVESWSKQLDEAKAYSIDSTSPTPLIDAILLSRSKSTASSLTKDQLVSKILSKATQYAQAVGILTGERQRCEAEILSATTLDEINAVKWINPLDSNDNMGDDPFSVIEPDNTLV